MENNSLDIIKKTEEEFELAVKKKQEALAKKKNERIKFWQEKEREAVGQFQAKKENIAFELKGRFGEIDGRLSKECRLKKEELKENAKKNFENFRKEIFKRL